MVRLKENFLARHWWCRKISIPYGAIKRINKNMKDYIDYEFQFLMVRLKEITKNSTKLTPANFNSLWCD